MTLAEVVSDVDLSEYVGQVLLFLFILGSIALVLCSVVLGETSVASSSARSRKHVPLARAFDTSNDAKEQPTAAKAPLIPPLTPGQRRERRNSLRRRGNPVGVLVLAGEGRAEPGLVLDRSKGGFCLSVAQPVDVGATLRVRTCHAPDDVPWIDVLVRHCAQKGDRWHLGCQFAEELPWSVLLLFG